MEIEIISYKNNNRLGQINKAINILNGVQNYFYFKPDLNSENDFCSDEYINWQKFCAHNNHATDSHTIYITDKPFDDNWFSHESNNYAIISTNNWEEIFAPPSLKSYLSYQIAQAAINFEADLSENMAMRIVHDRAEGCMFDFCQNKFDIKLGMIAGTICPKCRGILHRYGVEENALNAIERILLSVRYETIGKPQLYNEKQAFVVMRFTTNDENDNAYKYGIKAALDELRISCIRADNKVSSGQILQKIEKYIEKSRFIITKVDSDNLNVFFELGLAMGKDKDVLLISENNLVLQLPSDLRNWECLTYQKGNYEELKEKIKKFFCDNYHY